MPFKHSREQVREAKRAALDQLKDDSCVTSVGIGLAEDEQDYAVTITVSDSEALERIPDKIGTVSVRKWVTDQFTKLS